MKKILSVIAVTILLFSMCTIAYASENTKTEPDGLYGAKYTYISNATTSLSIKRGLATITNSISCYSVVDRIEVSTYLQKNVDGVWTTLQHWTDTEYDDDYVGSHSYYVVSGYNYRALTYFYAYDGEQSESTYLIDYEAY